jgi:hypothetical protein
MKYMIDLLGRTKHIGINSKRKDEIIKITIGCLVVEFKWIDQSTMMKSA